jgi:hypothetical protein
MIPSEFVIKPGDIELNVANRPTRRAVKQVAGFENAEAELRHRLVRRTS